MRYHGCEHRLIGYKSNIERFGKETMADYVHLPREKQNTLDRTTHTIAAGLNVFNSGIDAIIGDVVTIGKERKLYPLKPGYFSRLGRDVHEISDAVQDKQILKFIATGIKGIGDGVMDGVDLLIGNTHRNAA